jgi:hypothetical protein
MHIAWVKTGGRRYSGIKNFGGEDLEKDQRKAGK